MATMSTIGIKSRLFMIAVLLPVAVIFHFFLRHKHAATAVTQHVTHVAAATQPVWQHMLISFGPLALVFIGFNVMMVLRGSITPVKALITSLCAIALMVVAALHPHLFMGS